MMKDKTTKGETIVWGMKKTFKVSFYSINIQSLDTEGLAGCGILRRDGQSRKIWKVWYCRSQVKWVVFTKSLYIF